MVSDVRRSKGSSCKATSAEPDAILSMKLLLRKVQFIKVFSPTWSVTVEDNKSRFLRSEVRFCAIAENVHLMTILELHHLSDSVEMLQVFEILCGFLNFLPCFSLNNGYKATADIYIAISFTSGPLVGSTNHKGDSSIVTQNGHGIKEHNWTRQLHWCIWRTEKCNA